MAEHVGASADALASARSLLAARDRELAAADAELAEAVSSAHAAATEAIRKLDGIHAEIEAAVDRQVVTAPVEGREFARFLLAKQREISDILIAARNESDAKAIVLRHLLERYRMSSPPS
ncbi:DUF4226 domain-containing protein [Mycolicibacterium sp. P1-5]|uniref:DUF4226 domain-containing protein n=1 Tax=Mycolicibacterium sp. P1-5 TaxID=2024617 RepID=UPI0011ED203D|nr:DUF4226 domain-containing protein [Mycolicibacterium sp. P1-5]KAA0101650.1 DUF4226 domain-containing protein [Mycolicibacterium sp. P1-5]